MNPEEIKAFLEQLFGKALSAKATGNLNEAGPVAEGMTRMFRGGDAPDAATGAGQMFSKSLPTAAGFAKNQAEKPLVRMVDVPNNVADRGSLPAKGITKISGAGPTGMTGAEDAASSSFLVNKYAKNAKQIFPILAAIASGKLTDDALADPASAQAAGLPTELLHLLPSSDELIKTGAQGNYGVPQDAELSPQNDPLQKAQGAANGQEWFRRLEPILKGLDGGEASNALGNVGLAGAPPVGPEKRILSGAAALAKGEGVLSKASAEAANTADATLPSAVGALPRSSKGANLPSEIEQMIRARQPQVSGSGGGIPPTSGPGQALPSAKDLIPRGAQPIPGGGPRLPRSIEGVPLPSEVSQLPRGQQPTGPSGMPLPQRSQEFNLPSEAERQPRGSGPAPVGGTGMPLPRSSGAGAKLPTAGEQTPLGAADKLGKNGKPNWQNNAFEGDIAPPPNVPYSPQGPAAKPPAGEMDTIVKQAVRTALRTGRATAIKTAIGLYGAKWVYDTLFGDIPSEPNNNGGQP